MLKKVILAVKSWYFAAVAMLGAAFAVVMASAAQAAEGATYSIKPVTESITSELAANVPTILAITGALIALVVAVRFVKKFVKA